MATKTDIRAAKERKQKIVLAVGGVVLLGVLALQGPKLIKQLGGSSSKPPAPAAAAAPAPSTGASSATAAATATAQAVTIARRGGPSAQLAGVVIAPAPAPGPIQGQLWSFSRFKPKDPFVQQVQDIASSPTGKPSGTPAVVGGAAAAAPATPGAAAPAPPTYATLLVDGKPQQLVLKQLFPKGDPTFVLAGVHKLWVQIGVAGGGFTGGATLKLELGKPVTLMNTTTGQRFVVKLVYTGVQPEQIAGFKAPVAAAATPAAGTSVVRVTASSKP